MAARRYATAARRLRCCKFALSAAQAAAMVPRRNKRRRDQCDTVAVVATGHGPHGRAQGGADQQEAKHKLAADILAPFTGPDRGLRSWSPSRAGPRHNAPARASNETAALPQTLFPTRAASPRSGYRVSGRHKPGKAHTTATDPGPAYEAAPCANPVKTGR